METKKNHLHTHKGKLSMQTDTLHRCLEHTCHNCGMSKAIALIMPTIIQGDGFETVKYRFELVDNNLKNAATQLEKVGWAAREANCMLVANRITSLQKKLAAIQERAKRNVDPVIPPIIHFMEMQREVHVAFALLQCLEEIAAEVSCQPVLTVLAEKVVEFGHKDI